MKYKKKNLIRSFNRFVKEMIEDRDLVVFTRKLKPGSRFAVFGGMLRDMSFSNHKRFSSDIDVVIEQVDNTYIINILKEYNARINKYGGFRINVGRWIFDLWMLENTWAFKQGLVRNINFESLIYTTFFNWDAIVLELGNKKNTIYCKNSYFEDLEKRYLSVNLKENPNPNSVVAKALRYFIVDNANLSYELSEYIISNTNKLSRPKIYEKALNMSMRRGLSPELMDMALDQIKKHLENSIEEPLTFKGPQMELTFDTNFLEENEELVNTESLKNELSSKVNITYIKNQISLI